MPFQTFYPAGALRPVPVLEARSMRSFLRELALFAGIPVLSVAFSSGLTIGATSSGAGAVAIVGGLYSGTLLEKPHI